jgi:GMP reductase
MDIKLDFDDVLIVPQFSDITSRSQVDLVTTIEGKWGSSITGVPIVAANMDGVGTFSMCAALAKHQVFTAITKHHSVERWDYAMRSGNPGVKDFAFITIGMSDEDLHKAKVISELMQHYYGDVTVKVVIDVANGYMNPFYDFIRKTRIVLPKAFIMAGTVTTAEATKRVIKSGADLARVGIGTGAVCTTRRMAGVGFPLFSALAECAEAADEVSGSVQSDGGCVFPGDFSKAFGVGAQMVMAGSIFAGHDESEQEIHDGKVTFYGMSSHAAQKKHNQVKNYRASEGRIVQIPYRGPVENTISDILGGIRSTCAYVGAKTIEELPKKTQFVRVNNQINHSLEKYTIKT